jgi:hypothetical protein
MSLSGLVQHTGEAVTFTATTRTQDDSTGHTTPAAAAVAGYLRRSNNDSQEIADLGLVGKQVITGTFIPSTAGEAPAWQAAVTLDGVAFTVAKVEPYKPAGVVIYARVVLSR